MATVLIIGASKGVGLETIKQALEAGHKVRALARSAEHIEISNPNLVPISASATDEVAINEAITGCNAVITTLGISPTFQDVTLFSDSIQVVIKAMQNHGVKRLISVTGLGAGESKNSGNIFITKMLRPFFLGTIYDDKTREEDHIQNSTLDWTIVRPGILTRLPAKKTYQVLTEKKKWKIGFISRADVADFLINQIDDTAYIHKSPVLIY
ncbi:MAG: SDR family oxidoreductase [Pseudomonadota bacterium]